MRLLLGGSPCTFWSIAQTNNRETEPSGMGWELFKNYLIAKEKYKPDYFLYENNKSMSKEIREQITRELGVEPILINSALVSGQSRQRLYWTNILGVTQPEDRGILLRDVLDNHAQGYNNDKAYTLRASAGQKCGMSNILRHIESGGQFGYQGVAEPVRAGTMPTRDGKPDGGQARRIYDLDGKSVTLKATDGGQGTATGLYAMPIKSLTENEMAYMLRETKDGKTHPVYSVVDGLITIRDKQYPIKLPDGLYIIRKLTVTECMRLQTVPEDYIFPVSNTQAYKLLGNGWTVDVIVHILGHIPEITTAPVEVLSMYDGMSCGRLALNKLGANVARYYATEIDKYAIQATMHNFPDTIQMGDAFQVREDGWHPRITA